MRLKGERVAQEIRELRKARRLSQDELAVLITTTRGTISNIERNRQQVSLEMFCDAAFALGTTPPDLLSRMLSPSPAIDLSNEIDDPLIRKMVEDSIS